MASSTCRALREWAVVVEALREGRQILLLRKGGIHDGGGRFAAWGGRFFFIPGFEHQKAELLKPEDTRRFGHLLAPGGEPGLLSLQTIGCISEDLVLADPAKARRLGDHHIWSEEYVEMRINYRPELPLHLLLIRAHVLPSPREIPNLPRYAGCRSWVELDESVRDGDARPALEEEEFRKRVGEVKDLLGAS